MGTDAARLSRTSTVEHPDPSPPATEAGAPAGALPAVAEDRGGRTPGVAATPTFAAVGTERLADLVGALLSHPDRPDPTRLPQPRPEPPDCDETEPSPAAAAAQLLVAPPPALSIGIVSPPPPPVALTAAGAGAAMLYGPTGLGTAAARAFRDDSEPEDDEEMPELFCPGPLRDNAALGEEVNEGLVAWAEEVGIYPDALDRLRDCQFGRLIMLCHPQTDDPDRLLAATKCVVAGVGRRRLLRRRGLAGRRS